MKCIDRVPPGWFVLDVLRTGSRGWDWAALMVDVRPRELKHCRCSGIALLYVHPKQYRPGVRTARDVWVRIPGKHRNQDAAYAALQDLMATRH